MIKKLTYRDVVWLDLESPSAEELAEVAKDYNLHPVAVAELARASLRSKVDVYKNFVYLILHLPVCQLCAAGAMPAVDDQDQQEIDFIIGHNFLITVHYEPIDSLHEFSKSFEAGAWSRPEVEVGEIHAGFAFFHLLRSIYHELANGLDYINQRLKQIEKSIFSGAEEAVVKRLTEVNRDLLDFRWAFKSHSEVLRSLASTGDDFFGQGFRYYLQAIVGEQDKIWQMIESNRATFLDLRETNDSLLSIKNNETIKALTVIAFIFLPMTIIVQLFGMNTVFLPIIGLPYDFYIILGIILVITFSTYLLARYRRWL